MAIRAVSLSLCALLVLNSTQMSLSRTLDSGKDIFDPIRYTHVKHTKVVKCPYGWDRIGSHCFQFVSSWKSWPEAEEDCLKMGANIVSVHSEEVNNFIKNLVKKHTGKDTRVWLGANDAIEVGKWFWTDGSKFEFNQWLPGEPNNYGGREHCLEMNFRVAGKWNDAPCNQKFPYVCQKQASEYFPKITFIGKPTEKI